MKKKKKKIVIGIVILLVIALAAAAFMFFKKPGMPNAQSGTNTAVAQKMTIVKTISSDGEIQGALEENIEPHTSYYLKSIKVEEGEAVSEGEIILKYTNGKTMTAPYDCVVESWYLPSTGSQLTTDHYVTISGTDVLQIELSIDEDEISQVSLGDYAEVTVDAVDKTYNGEVGFISQKGTYSGGTSTFTAKVRFDNDGKLKLGMNGSAVITLDKAEDVLAVPKTAVHTMMDQKFVTVQSGDTTKEMAVETGLSNDSYIEIKSGLEEGQTVVVPESDDNSSGFPSFGGSGGFPGGSSGGPSGFPGGSSGGSSGPPSGGFPGSN